VKRAARPFPLLFCVFVRQAILPAGGLLGRRFQYETNFSGGIISPSGSFANLAVQGVDGEAPQASQASGYGSDARDACKQMVNTSRPVPKRRSFI
jgi:hypothetical protein